MEVLHPRCAGLDVHSRQVTACVREAAGRDGHDRAPRVRDDDGGPARTVGVADRDRLHARGMEATGVYWKPVWHILGDEASFDAGARQRAAYPGMFRAARATRRTRPGSPTCWRTG